jgi:hypothetical protein
LAHAGVRLLHLEAIKHKDAVMALLIEKGAIEIMCTVKQFDKSLDLCLRPRNASIEWAVEFSTFY